MSDSEEKSEKKPKNFYTEYKYYCLDLSETEKKINKELNIYKKKIIEGTNTVENERQIKTLLKYYQDIKDQLSEAYSERNAPSGYPTRELDKRQKEIQQFGFNYDKMAKEFHDNENEKYKFKGGIDEDYTQKEEYKYLNSQELMKLQKNKIKNQDEQIENITLDVKKNTQLAKQTKHVIKEQNEKLEQINEDIDRTHEKMSNLTERFKKYASGQSWCKLIIIIILELTIAFVSYFLLMD